jgi:hypothetical protein
MIELLNNELAFRFPEVHPEAGCRISFQRTLRIPDDNREYPLPPGLGRFPVEHVDDFSDSLPDAWRRHGGVFIPMYQSEALWINFDGDYPCAVKIAAGKINAVSGQAWDSGLSQGPQNYAVIPRQPWLDGFNVSEGHVRQFVAMPLGEGSTAEEQITGKAEFGGLQILVYPMKREVYERLIPPGIASAPAEYMDEGVCCRPTPLPMGLAPGGLMRQKIYEDRYGLDAWDMGHSARCFVHLANSEMYQGITGHMPPHHPPTAKEYTEAGLPWFDYYSDAKALPGSDILSKLKGLAAKVVEKGQPSMKDNDAIQPSVVRELGNRARVRQGEF